jgi:hypothetical protein
MKTISLAIVLTIVITTSAMAGNVYGTITDAGKALGKGVKLEITCGTNKYEGETDEKGGFKLFVKDEGKCVLKLSYQNQTPTVEVNSFEGSVQYDLILDKQGTQYTLKRK